MSYRGEGDEDGNSGLLPLNEWKFSQVFREHKAGEDIQEVDIISAIEFDKSGEHLAMGDRGGRVVLFERTDKKEMLSREEMESSNTSVAGHPNYQFKTQFQSHEPEFDYLRSLEIGEKINKIRWCQTANSALFLLSTNDKTIKLWKVQGKRIKKVSDLNVDVSTRLDNGNMVRNNTLVNTSTRASVLWTPNGGPSASRCANDDFLVPSVGISSLRLPVVASNELTLFAKCQRVFTRAHDYHINSISNNSDGETFISADDLRINLWNLAISDESYNIIDIKPANMEDLTEVITSAEFHPTHCNMLAYSSSKGTIRLVDMRQSALCDRHSKLFEEQEAHGSRSFFTEIIASISDIKFGRGGRYILSRDYMTLKLWDINMESGPVANFKIHEHLRPKLCELYENDSIFDKFECCLSADGLHVATGSYSNLFRIFGCVPTSDESTTLEASKSPNRRLAQVASSPGRALANLTCGQTQRGNESPGSDINGGANAFTSKLLHLAWHPTSNTIACATSNSLYIYYS